MHIIYKITYLPHLSTNNPKYYIGSKFNYKPGYMGSVASNKKFLFTGDVSLRQWWKEQTKHYKQNFVFEILEDCSSMNKNQLLDREKHWQEKLNIISEEFFNQAYANGQFVSKTRDDSTKNKLSESLKNFYITNQGLEKRKKLIERNKTTHSSVMLEKWKHPSESMINRKITGRRKGSKDLKKRCVSFKKITDGVNVFNDALEASIYYNITPTSIRRRCRLNFEGTWKYIDENCNNN